MKTKPSACLSRAALSATFLLTALQFPFAPAAHAGGGQPTLIGWNNLGMHCMDDDYSVFTILPPFNTIDAHFIDAAGHLITTPGSVTVTFEAMADPDGSFNSTVEGKTNFWDYVLPAYGYDPALGQGLFGTWMPGPGNPPQPMIWAADMRWFEALGIPITPVDDAGNVNPYPLLRLVARDAAGTLLAETHVVAPVSSEMDCRACHSSGVGPAARPNPDWVYDPNDKRDFRLNILLLHDQRRDGNPDYQAALDHYGWPGGLYDAVVNHGASILCAKCHLSEALPATGYGSISPLTQAIHSKHATVEDPETGMALDNIANRGSCYTCHPGSATRCLRGAMGAAVAADGTMAMQCQSCHGRMSDVGATGRIGWLDEPNCQQCHTGTATDNMGQIRYTDAFIAPGVPRVPTNLLFATNPDTPVADVSLYRFSKGHGNLQCSACHGSTHAEYPASHRNDNLQSVALQGHAGVVADCTACHATMPSGAAAVAGGPHGMHPISENWIKSHEDYGTNTSCKGCHGTDLKGTVLSRAFADRTITFSEDGQTHSLTLWRGETLSCFICHKQEDNGSLGGLFNNNQAPVAANALLLTPQDTSGGLTLTSTDAEGNPRSYRIVQQPLHGSVALAPGGAAATYFPEPGYTGPDSFTFAAFDGFRDSNQGIISVSVGNPPDSQDTDGDGLIDLFEYALGTSPDFPTVYSTPGLELVGGERYLQMTLPQGIMPMDTNVVIEVSPDLLSWTPATVVSTVGYQVTARDPVPAGVGTARFIRARMVRL